MSALEFFFSFTACCGDHRKLAFGCILAQMNPGFAKAASSVTLAPWRWMAVGGWSPTLGAG